MLERYGFEGVSVAVDCIIILAFIIAFKLLAWLVLLYKAHKSYKAL